MIYDRGVTGVTGVSGQMSPSSTILWEYIVTREKMLNKAGQQTIACQPCLVPNRLHSSTKVSDLKQNENPNVISRCAFCVQTLAPGRSSREDKNQTNREQ